MIGPCKDCTAETGRYPGCSDHCPRYAEWRAYEAEIKRKKKEYFAPAETLASGRARWYEVERRIKHARRKQN